MPIAAVPAITGPMIDFIRRVEADRTDLSAEASA
jgi:hypothetical protein